MVCGSVLQRVAVCSGVLQCVAVCCSVLQCVAVCCSVLQCGAGRYNIELERTRTVRLTPLVCLHRENCLHVKRESEEET